MCFLMGHYLSELLPTENHILPQIHNDCGPSLISGLGAFRKDFLEAVMDFCGTSEWSSRFNVVLWQSSAGMLECFHFGLFGNRAGLDLMGN